ncbi:MAG TPA: glycine C-acetyltransferase [Blastocatellia bacterium]|nr:glycine C-acetyltransferase [Blastocatellia bacterium]
MNPNELYAQLDRELGKIKEAKTFKYEVPLESEQGGLVMVEGRKCVMLASNNYLGLSSHPRIKEAAHRAIDEWGYGLASVRFLCGTEPIHFELERRIAKFVGCESAILHSSCFAANEAFFAALLANDFGNTDYQDVIYSDQLNHASIIDGVRLCRAIAKQTVSRLYRNGDVKQLREMLEEDRDKNYRVKIIATDGVFSMEGLLAPLPELVRLAREHGALLFVDESHATGVLGETGRGTPEDLDVYGEIDVITGTFGKALGGASGGFIAGRSPLVEFIRQKSRPYTFSNTMPPPVVTGSIEAIDLIENDPSIVNRLHENTEYFRREIVRLGFKIIEGRHPIVPIMLGEAAVAQDMSRELLDEGVYIKGLWYPVVPKGEARLRAQISAAHTRRDLDRALEAFNKVGKRAGVI